MEIRHLIISIKRSKVKLAIEWKICKLPNIFLQFMEDDPVKFFNKIHETCIVKKYNLLSYYGLTFEELVYKIYKCNK